MKLYKDIENTEIYRIIIWYYVQNAVSRGILNLVLWSRDIVPLAEMMTRSRAPSVYSDREVGNSAEVGFFPNLDWINFPLTFSYPLTHPHTGPSDTHTRSAKTKTESGP